MDALRPLGNTGIRVSPIGLGTVKLGRNQGVKYPAPFDLPSDEQATALLQTAADLGINLIDTAPAYGTSEARLGELMARANWFGARERWVVCTKAGEEFEHGASRFDFSPHAVRASVERSRARLGVDVLDIVLIHSSGADEEILRTSGAAEALHELKASGAIRSIGISSKTVAGGMLAIEMGLDVIMVTFNQLEQEQLPVIHAAGRRGVGVLIKKALASGHNVSGGADEALRSIFTQTGDAVSSIVVGTVNASHLRHNAAALH